MSRKANRLAMRDIVILPIRIMAMRLYDFGPLEILLALAIVALLWRAGKSEGTAS